MCDKILSNHNMSEVNHSVRGIQINKFYGRTKTKHLDMKNIRRKHKLSKVENFIASRKSADALALRIYDFKKENSPRKHNIITYYSKEYAVFSKQEDAIKFSHEKVK